MIRSMTGFCKLEVSHADVTCRIEIRSVNHRFLDAKIHLPNQFQLLEELLKKQVKDFAHRGKIDIYLQVDSNTEQSQKLTINSTLWENLKYTVKTLEDDIGRKIPINLSDLIGIKGLLTYEQEEIKVEDMEILFSKAIKQGMAELIKMREREGELLLKEITQHLETLKDLITEIPQYCQKVSENYRHKLQKNLQSLELKYDQNDPRIMQEIGIFLDRSDITEEVERFSSHLIQMEELLKNDESVGRKLDFILQELNREANTLCSKSNHIKLSQTGIELKHEIEKIREQVQNIE